MKQSKLVLLGVIFLLCALSLYAASRWSTRVALDKFALRFISNDEKANKAAEYASLRANETKGFDDEMGIRGAYAVQDLLSVIEQNMNIAGNQHKALRQQQEVESKLHDVKNALDSINAQSDEYKLILKNTSVRIDLILEELALAEQKTKAKIAQES